MELQLWQKVFRDGIAPSLSTPGLEALREALLRDDPTLIQGATTVPPPLPYISDWPVESACPLGYTAWKGDGKEKIGEVEEFFALTCAACDNRLNEPASVRYFLNAWDESPRAEMLVKLRAVVEAILAQRYGKSAYEEIAT